MQQIKNYLSKLYDIKTVLLLSKTQEFSKLAEWLVRTKNIEIVHLSDEQPIDAVIFDWNCEIEILSLADCKPRYLIGRMKKKKIIFVYGKALGKMQLQFT